jgi:predicted MFS family arabinose efflux permease
MLRTTHADMTGRPMTWGGLAALVTLGTAGVTTFLAMPVIAAALVNELGASEKNVGLFSTIQLITLSMGCLVSTFLPQGHCRRYGLIALGIMIVCDGLCLMKPEWTLFLVLRGLGGGAGGIAVSQATAAMAQTRNPERSFGLFLALQTMVAVVCVYTMPVLISAYGFHAAYGLLMGFSALAMLMVYAKLPISGSTEAQALLPGNASADWLRCAGILASILCFFVGVGVIWTFLALLGQGVGLSPGQIALILSISKVVAFAASFLPGLIGNRFGRIVPILVSVAILTGATQVYGISHGLIGFVIATALFSLGWFVIYPFQLGALGQVDQDGRPMLAAAALTGAGLGIGPALTVLGPGGAAGIYLIATLAFLAAGLFAVAALVRAPIASLAIAKGQ